MGKEINIHAYAYIESVVDIRLTIMVRTLELFLFLFLHPVSLHCKLILLSNASKLVNYPHWENKESHSYAEILNTSLQRFDNFTLCARYRVPGYPKSPILYIISLLHFKHAVCCQIPHLQLLDVIWDTTLPESIHIKLPPNAITRKSNVQPSVIFISCHFCKTTWTLWLDPGTWVLPIWVGWGFQPQI